MKSIEEKAKAYHEALVRAQTLNDQFKDSILGKNIEFIFPELKESEGEKVKKAIFGMVYDSDDELWSSYDVSKSDVLAWLEKQGEQKPNYCHHEVDMSGCSKEYRKAYYDGWNNCNQQHAQLEAEQKPADKVEPKFKVGDLVKYTNHNKQPIYKVTRIDKECYICTSDDATLGDKAVMHFALDNPYLRLVEQKPAWSEEDEKHIMAIDLAVSRCIGKWNCCGEKCPISEHNPWLKSLKDRYTWKPSDEQIDALNDAIDICSKQNNEIGD